VYLVGEINFRKIICSKEEKVFNVNDSQVVFAVSQVMWPEVLRLKQRIPTWGTRTPGVREKS